MLNNIETMISQVLFISVLLMTIAVSSFAQFHNAESLGPKLKGKIDSIITPSSYGKTIAIFNKKGQLAEFYDYKFMRTEFNGQIHDTTRTIYEYDKKGLLSKSICNYSRHDTGTQPWRTTYTTNWNFVKEGDIYIAKFDHHRDDGSTYQEIFKLNSSFQLIEETDLSNTYITSEFKTYDKNGYLVSEHRTVKRPDNTLPTTNYTYYTNDAEGNVIVRATKGPIFKYTYTRYDKMHNWLERNNYKVDIEEIEDYLMGKSERRITYHK